MAFLPAIPLGFKIAGASGIASIAGNALSGGAQIPDWLRDMLKAEIARDRSSQFVPDEAAFTAQTESNIDRILARLPVGIENFEADLASRGIRGSGEATGRKFADVIAPITREATGAAVSGQVAFEGLKQRGNIAADQARNQLIALLTGSTNPEQDFLDRLFGGIGSLGAQGAQIGALSGLGVFK